MRWFVILMSNLALTLPASADSLDHKFAVNVGAFFTDRDTEVRLDSELLGRGTLIDLEDQLGLDKSDAVFRLDGFYRFNRRHRLDFSVFDLSRDATATIDETVQFGDRVFAVNTTVSTEFDLLIAKMAYTWAFIERPQGFLGATLGVYVADVTIGISEPNLGSVETGDITAPLPVVGLRGEYLLSERWSLRASSELFFVEIDDVEGQLVDLNAGIRFQAFDNVAFGLAYNAVTIDVESGKRGFTGELDWQYNGALLYVEMGLGAVP